MRRPEDLSTRTPGERFFWVREYYQTEINRGTMGGTLAFGKLFSEKQDLTKLTHDMLDEAVREMNKYWVGDPRIRQWRPLPASTASTTATSAGKSPASKP